jgi:hypothetical protein
MDSGFPWSLSHLRNRSRRNGVQVETAMTGADISQSPAPLRAPFARPFIGISSQDELNIAKAIAEWPEDTLSQDGFTPTRE